jgi:AcrR family transcriptional regulator
MGRAITFDKEMVLTSCLQAFWKGGFNNTSIRDLQKLTGLSGRSLIHSFGDKKSIFNLCLRRYIEFVEQLTQNLINEETGLDSFFETFTLCGPKDARHNGCFILNSISGGLKKDPQLIAAFKQFEQLLVEFFIVQLNHKNLKNTKHKANIVFDIFLAGLTRVSIYEDANQMENEFKLIKKLIASWCS